MNRVSNSKKLPMVQNTKLDPQFNDIVSNILIKELNRAHFYGQNAYNNIFISAIAEYVENELHNYLRQKTNKSYCVQVDIPRSILINGQEVVSLSSGQFIRIINSLLNNMDWLKKECDNFIQFTKNRKSIINDLKNKLYTYMIEKDYVVNKDKLKITYSSYNDYNTVNITAYYASYQIFNYTFSLSYGLPVNAIAQDMYTREKQYIDAIKSRIIRYIMKTLKLPNYKVISVEEQYYLFNNCKVEQLCFTDKLTNRLVEELRDKYKSTKLLYELSDTNNI